MARRLVRDAPSLSKKLGRALLAACAEKSCDDACMARTLFVWPVDPSFHPDPAQEEAAKSALQAAIGDAGDVDCDSYSEPRLSRAGDEPYSARFVIRACDALELLSAETLAEVSKRLGCRCKQALVDDGK